MPQTPTRHPADTWPPTQLRLSPSLQHSPLDMPLSYFFSTDHHADTDVESHLYDFTAGIEDTKPNFLGTLSSSSLLRRRHEARDVHALSDPSSESDDEDYVRFPAGVEVRRCPDETRRSGVNAKGKRKKGSSRDVAISTSNPRSRGRAPRRDDDNRRGANNHGTQRQRAWREPSPYVWSINEEEEDGSSGILKKKGKDVARKSAGRAVSLPQEEPLDEKAVEERLRKRKVRFALPAKE